MNDFLKLKTMKKLSLLGFCAGVIVVICSDDKKPYLRTLSAITIGALMGKCYNIGLDTYKEIMEETE